MAMKFIFSILGWFLTTGQRPANKLVAKVDLISLWANGNPDIPSPAMFDRGTPEIITTYTLITMTTTM